MLNKKTNSAHYYKHTESESLEHLYLNGMVLLKYRFSPLSNTINFRIHPPCVACFRKKSKDHISKPVFPLSLAVEE